MSPAEWKVIVTDTPLPLFDDSSRGVVTTLAAPAAHTPHYLRPTVAKLISQLEEEMWIFKV